MEVLPTLLESQEMPATCTEYAGARTVGASLSSSQLSTHAYTQIVNKYVLTKYFVPDTGTGDTETRRTLSSWS